MSRFLALPLEIRITIYKYCLVVGKVFPYLASDVRSSDVYGHPDWEQEALEYELPEISLLAVCKSIYQEAEPILYQKNIFALPVGPYNARFFYISLNTDERQAWVTSVEVRFYPISMNEWDMDSHYRMTDLDHHLLFVNKVRLSLHRTGLYSFLDTLQSACEDHSAFLVWPRDIEPLLSLLRLEKLVIDVSHWVDYSTVCKAAESVFKDGFLKGMPKQLEILGATADGHSSLTTFFRTRDPQSLPNAVNPN